MQTTGIQPPWGDRVSRQSEYVGCDVCIFPAASAIKEVVIQDWHK